MVVSSKREIYTARLSFICVVKERGGGEGGRAWNFLLLCVHYTPLLMLFNIELLRKRNIFRGGGGGGGGGELVFVGGG